MMWGCMTAEGVGYACRRDGRMDAALYCRILSDELVDTLDYYRLNRDDIIFQQDNDPKHTSNLAHQWFEDNGVVVLEWPSQSADLNPIEHLWFHLKQKLNEYKTQPTSIHELLQPAEKERNTIPVQVYVNLIENMPRRVDEVLKAKGKHTKY